MGAQVWPDSAVPRAFESARLNVSDTRGAACADGAARVRPARRRTAANARMGIVSFSL
jgi:hypothetical protein